MIEPPACIDSGTPTPRKSSVWCISIYEGDSPLTLAPQMGRHTPVLTRSHVTDVDAAFVADPFMVREGGLWRLFFEVKNARTRHGEIAVASSSNGRDWDYGGSVLREPFHLSYPCVFPWDGAYYMTLETLSESAIWLYRAEEFPAGWKPVKMLVPGAFADPTIFRWNELWWLFACGSPFRHDTLSLFYSEDLMGEWREHPRSPILCGNPRAARPAGRVTNWNGKLLRFAQDCVPVYGSAVRAFEIEELTPELYREREVSESPILQAGTTWNRTGMHHVDPHQMADGRWIACVDGYSRGF